MRLRPAAEADAEAAAGLIIACDVASIGEPDFSLEQLRDEWDEVGFELAQDAVVVEGTDGTTIGYAHFRGSDLLAVVDPRREGEGAGCALLRWAERRGRERGLRRLRQPVGDRAANARALLEANGWAFERSYWRMERDVGPAEVEPDGLRAVRPDDARALHAIDDAAFATIPGYEQIADDVWDKRNFGSHDFDPALGRVVERDGAPVGFAFAHRWEDGVVYLSVLAVRPDAAGRGLGTDLLRGVFAAAGAAGLRQVRLNVASDNPNALRLYERVGMTQRWRTDDYQKPLPD